MRRHHNKIFGITVSSASPRSAVWSSRTAALIVPQDTRPPFRDTTSVSGRRAAQGRGETMITADPSITIIRLDYVVELL